MIRYPQDRLRLLELLQIDQHDIREHSKMYKNAPGAAETVIHRKKLAKRCKERAKEVLAILDKIKQPTDRNVGLDGSLAISVIALHSNLSTMKRVLETFEQSYKQNPNSVDYEAVAALLDRVLILQRKKQQFGTQWLVARDGSYLLYPVDDFKGMNARRKMHGLARARRPRDLTYGIPNGPLPPFAKAGDQRMPNDEEYNDYVAEMTD